MKHLASMIIMTILMFMFGVLLLMFVLSRQPEGKTYALVEQQKTLQIEAQSRAIQVVADKIPSMWPIVFLSCVGFISIVVMLWIVYKINLVRSSQQFIESEQYKELPQHNTMQISQEDINKIRMLVRQYDKYQLERSEHE